MKIPQISGVRHHTSTCGGRTGARHGHGRPREPRAGRQAAIALVDAHALPSLKGANGQVKQSNCDNSKTTGSWLDEQVLLNGGVGALSTLCLVRAPATCSAPWPRHGQSRNRDFTAHLARIKSKDPGLAGDGSCRVSEKSPDESTRRTASPFATITARTPTKRGRRLGHVPLIRLA